MDWRLFEERVLNDTSLQPPSFFLEELHSEAWNNIPIPLVGAVDTLKRALGNIENLLLFVCREQKARSEITAKKIRLFEARSFGESDDIRKGLQDTKKETSEEFLRTSKKIYKTDTENKQQLKTLETKVDNNHSYLVGELEEYEKIDAVQHWTKQLLNEKVYKVNASIA